jgi:hypothetical protein
MVGRIDLIVQKTQSFVSVVYTNRGLIDPLKRLCCHGCEVLARLKSPRCMVSHSVHVQTHSAQQRVNETCLLANETANRAKLDEVGGTASRPLLAVPCRVD